MKDGIVYKVVERKTTLIRKIRKKHVLLTISSVLKKSRRSFCSCIVFDMNCAVSYELGRTTKPKIGKLFAFDSLTAARKFKGRSRIILKCKAKNIKPEHKKCNDFTSSGFKRFWSSRSRYFSSAPQGTVVCDYVTPIRIVR